MHKLAWFVPAEALDATRDAVFAAGAGAAVSADSAIWVVGYRIDDRVRVTSRTRRYLWLSVDPC